MDNLKIHTSPAIGLKQLLDFKNGIAVVVPLDEITLGSKLVCNIKWKDVVGTSAASCFNIGQLKFQKINLSLSELADGRLILNIDNSKSCEILHAESPKVEEVGMSETSTNATINGKLQFCFTLIKSDLRTQTINFFEDLFPEKNWEDVYGESLKAEAEKKKDNKALQELCRNWEEWENHDVEFSNFYIIINQHKNALKGRFGWSTNSIRRVNDAIRKIAEVRNPSSHQNLDEETLSKTDDTIRAMETVIKSFSQTMGEQKVNQRLEQFEEARLSINKLKKM